MNLFFAFVLICSSDLVLTKEKQPTIVARNRHPTENCKPDPLSPCVNEVLVIENPLYKPVVVGIVCGEEFDQAEVDVPARSRLAIDVELTMPSPNGCQIGWWGYKK